MVGKTVAIGIRRDGMRRVKAIGILGLDTSAGNES